MAWELYLGWVCFSSIHSLRLLTKTTPTLTPEVWCFMCVRICSELGISLFITLRLQRLVWVIFKSSFFIVTFFWLKRHGSLLNFNKVQKYFFTSMPYFTKVYGCILWDTWISCLLFYLYYYYYWVKHFHAVSLPKVLIAYFCCANVGFMLYLCYVWLPKEISTNCINKLSKQVLNDSVTFICAYLL